MEINKYSLANKIKNLRNKLSLNQENFGKLFTPVAAKGIVSRWEKGQSIPNKERINKISELSGYSVKELLYGSLEEEILKLINFAFQFMPTSIEKITDVDYNSNDLSHLSVLSNLKAFAKFYNLSTNQIYLNYDVKSSGKDSDNYLNEVQKNEKYYKEYYLKETIKRCRLKGLEPTNQIAISRTLAYVAERKLDGETDTDIGFLTFVFQNLTDLQENYIDNFLYVENNNTGKKERISNSISEKLEKDVFNVLEEAKNDIFLLKNQLPD